MDKLARYREIIKHVLQKHVASANRRPQPGVERFMVADETRDHYFLFSLDWVDRSATAQLQRLRAAQGRPVLA